MGLNCVPGCTLPATESAAPLTDSWPFSKVDFSLSGFKVEAALSVVDSRLVEKLEPISDTRVKQRLDATAENIHAVRHDGGCVVWLMDLVGFCFG